LQYNTEQFLVPQCYVGDLRGVVITEGMIKDRIKQLAREIHENIGDQAVTFICVLKGSYRFFTTLVDELSDVRYACKTQISIDFIRAKSYEDTETTGTLQLIGLSSMDELKDQNVLVCFLSTTDSPFRLSMTL
jgi:hypoxanthine phosphoribosyltransferase